MKFIVYTDGATRPTNPGPSGYGAVLYQDDVLLAKEGGYIGENMSNNQAEYAGMIAGLQLAGVHLHNHITDVVVRSDSKLVINQVLGEWAVRVAKLGPLHAAVIREMGRLKELGITVTLEHVRGHRGEEGNELADEMAGYAVEHHLPAHARILKYVAHSHDKSVIKKKGHEKLYDDVLKAFNNTVMDLSAGIPNTARVVFNQQNDDPTSALVLQFPRLVSVRDGKTRLLSLSTGFKRLGDSKITIRTMDKSAFEVASSLGQAGYNVIVLHRPHSKDSWMTDVQLGWGTTGKEVPMAYTDVNNLTAGEVFAQEGWPPFIELSNSEPWKFYGK